MKTQRRGAFFLIVLLAAAATGFAAPTPKTLNNSGDPTLALTPPLRGSGPAPQGSPPPNPDPRNFEGVWWLQGYEYMLGPESGVAPPLKPEYMKVLERRIRAKNRGTPEADASTQCLPHGMPRLMESPYPIEIVQTPGRLTFLHEVAHNVRRIWLNRPHPKNPTPSYLGDSVGHWEGDTLVVDTIGFNDSSWLDIGGYFHSENLHVIERLRRDGNNLIWQATVEDPDVLLKPWVMNQRVQKLNPDPLAELAESLPCVERDLSHLVTKEHH